VFCLGFAAAFAWAPVALVALLVTFPAVLAVLLAGGLATTLASGLATVLTAGLAGYITSFSPRPSSANGSRGPLLRCRRRGHSNLLLE
jgi:hypothetical protein